MNGNKIGLAAHGRREAPQDEKGNVREVKTMAGLFTLEYWLDDNWYVGRLKEIPGVFSQGETLNDLENNIREAYALMMEDDVEPDAEGRQTKQIEVAV